MHTPEEAIDELDFVTKQLGSKVGMFGSALPRKVPSVEGGDKDTGRLAVWYEVFGIDSIYDYDPVWQKCREVGIAPTFHSSGSNQALRNSPTNFTYNHIGHFADAGHAAAKGIFLGGVTRRFPELRFAFLEGGVGWGAQLFGDLMEHWERRNAKALENMRPDKLDRKLLLELVEKYGYQEHAAALKERDGWPDPEMHLTGGVAEVLPNHHITKPVFIGEIKGNGQFDVVWKTPGLVAGDAWSKELPDSRDLIGDWVGKKCGNYNTKTNKCGGQGS